MNDLVAPLTCQRPTVRRHWLAGRQFADGAAAYRRCPRRRPMARAFRRSIPGVRFMAFTPSIDICYGWDGLSNSLCFIEFFPLPDFCPAQTGPRPIAHLLRCFFDPSQGGRLCHSVWSSVCLIFEASSAYVNGFAIS